MYTEHFGKSIDNTSDKVEERAEIFPQTPETPMFLRIPEAVKTPECLEKIQFSKSPLFEM
jgi:rubredoxin